jgi:ABC-type branched-subunit amino acid transport system ATPase component
MLEIQDVHASYATVKVLFGVSFHVKPGESVCLLGRNGMGKTTIFRTITGSLRTESGTITLNGVDITRKKPFERARLGMRYIPDVKGVFDNLTVMENLKLAHLKTNPGSDLAEATDLFPELRGHLNQRAGTLSGGERKLLSVSMAIVSRPELPILDELSEGVAPLILERLSSALSALKRKGTMILLAEQNIQFGCKSSDRIYVVRGGRVVFEDTVDEFIKSDAVRKHIGLA